MTEIQKTIDEALNAARQIRKKRIILTFLAALVLFLVLAAAVDRFIMFSGWQRWIGWVGGLAFAIWAARVAGKAAAMNATTLAHQVEAEANESAPVIATAIDPAVREGESDEAGSVLLKRLDQRAADALKAAPPRFSGLLKAPVTLALIAVLCFVALISLHGHRGLARIVMPWTSSPYSKITLIGPTTPLPEGKTFAVTAQVTGIPVAEVTLFQEGSDTPVSRGIPDENGKLSLNLNGLSVPTNFIARGGDGESEFLRIEPYLLPQIEAFEIAVTPPEYLEGSPSIATDPSFSAIRGSRARYQIRLRAEADSVKLELAPSPREDEWISPEDRLGRGRSLSEEPADPPPVFHTDPSDPTVWAADWSFGKEDEILYRLVIEGKRGDKIRNEEPWRISILRDKPPEIKITSHNGEEIIQRGDETVAFQLSAVDDLGLDEVWLVFRKPGQPHIRQRVNLPPETELTWSGESLLDLAPLELKPFDIIAVHAEAWDGNTLDGPGVSRSEIVYLEIPLPQSTGDEGGDGGGGGGSPPINPLELQMEILRTTMVTPDDALQKERNALTFDQKQNAEFTEQLEMGVKGAGLIELGEALANARMEMVQAYRLFERRPPSHALPHVESALGHLIEAAKLLEEAGAELPPPPAGSAEGMTFTLSPPKPSSSDSSEESDDEGEEGENGEGMSEEEKEALANLMEEVKRQLAEQQSLNESQAGKPSDQPANSEQAAAQQSLASDARSSAEMARSLPSSSDQKGESKAAAEELERAAELQEENANALAEGDASASSKLGAESAEALREALLELASQLEQGNYNLEANSPGFERLVNDYLRAISYE